MHLSAQELEQKEKELCVNLSHKQCLAWGAAPRECCPPQGMAQGKPCFLLLVSLPTVEPLAVGAASRNRDPHLSSENWRSRFAVLFQKWPRKLCWATAATQMERFLGDKLGDDRWQQVSATYDPVFTSSDAHILLSFLLENQLFPACSSSIKPVPTDTLSSQCLKAA